MEPSANPVPGRRGFWRTAGLVLGVFFAGFLLLLAVAYAAGTVDVRVHEKQRDGTRIHLIVPSCLVGLGLQFAPDKTLSEAAEKAGPWLPAIELGARELARYPDVTLVEVLGGNETIRIATKRGRVVIDVDTPEETVHVSVPLGSVAGVVRRLRAARPPV